MQLPPLYPAQRLAFYNGSRYSICEASTKAGKTVGAIVWQLERCLLDTLGLNHWWVAPIYPQAEIAFRRAKKMLAEMLSKGRAKKTDSPPKIEFANGATWWFKSAEVPDNLYGEDVADAVLDEFTRMREDSWHAVRSTLTATQGPCRMIGNVKGRGNWGYRMARMAESGAPGVEHHKITADDAIKAGVLTQDEVDDARRMLPHSVFRELYYCEPSDDGGNPFGLGHIAACVRDSVGSKTGPVVYGVDLAKSVDWTVVVGIDAGGSVCSFDRWQHEPWERTESRISQIIGGVPALIDSTGVGDPIVERLRRNGLNVEGFKFTSQSKQQLMEGLAVAIQNREITFPDGPLRSELELFEYEQTRTGVRYSAPSGCHDDCVCALALAVSKRGRAGGRLLSFAEFSDREPVSVSDGLRGGLDFARLRENPDWGFNE